MLKTFETIDSKPNWYEKASLTKNVIITLWVKLTFYEYPPHDVNVAYEWPQWGLGQIAHQF